MANTIKIKRSQVTATPPALAEGELAYSFNSDTLFIGDTGGSNVLAIGGKNAYDKLTGIESGAQVNTVTSVAGKTGVVTLQKANITDFTEADYVHSTGAETINGNKTFGNSVTITGDLTVNGTTTTVNSNTVNIGDNIIVLNADETGAPSQDAGFEVERGTLDNQRLIWRESSDTWGVEIAGGAFTAISLAGHTHVAADITNFTTSAASVADIQIGAASINALSDVVITSPANTQVLTFNGSVWVNTASSSGVSTFTALTDTPAAYTGHAGKFVKVNTGETALEFISDVDGGQF